MKPSSLVVVPFAAMLLSHGSFAYAQAENCFTAGRFGAGTTSGGVYYTARLGKLWHVFQTDTVTVVHHVGNGNNTCDGNSYYGVCTSSKPADDKVYAGSTEIPAWAKITWDWCPTANSTVCETYGVSLVSVSRVINNQLSSPWVLAGSGAEFGTEDGDWLTCYGGVSQDLNATEVEGAAYGVPSATYANMDAYCQANAPTTATLSVGVIANGWFTEPSGNEGWIIPFQDNAHWNFTPAGGSTPFSLTVNLVCEYPNTCVCPGGCPQFQQCVSSPTGTCGCFPVT
jgi:hypothetical protein